MVGSDLQIPQNINDVLTIVAEPKWYGYRRDYKRGIVYRLAYGMFRIGYNQWAQHGSQEWMKNIILCMGMILCTKK